MIPGRLRRMVDQRIQRFGDGLAIVLRDRSTLRNQTTGTPTNALTVDGAHSAGVAVIDLEAANLVGSLPAGVVLTIGGTPYTTTAQVEAVAGNLVNVPISPVLDAPAAHGAAVTVSTPYVDTTYRAMRSKNEESDAVDGIADTARVYRLSALGQTRKPKTTDVLVDTDGRERAIDVGAPAPGGTPIYYSITVGSSA